MSINFVLNRSKMKLKETAKKIRPQDTKNRMTSMN